MTLIQAILIALWYYIVNSPWPSGGMGNYATVYRPLVGGFVVGLILGDPVTGTMIGATINMMYIGVISAGGAMPADMSLAGILGTAIAITGNIDANAALAIALPIGLLGTIVWVCRMTFNSFFVRIADKYVERGEPDKIWIANILLPQILLFAVTAIPCFFAAYYGASYIAGLIGKLGGKFLSVLSTVGGMLPAVGIAIMLLSIFKGKAKIFFFLGFLASAYLGLGILPIAFIFFCITLLYMGFEGGLSSLKTADDEEVDRVLFSGISKKHLNRAWWKWMYYFQSCYNYERMQGIGFLHAMSSVIKQLYKDDKEERIAAMKRHAEFFNTENATGSIVVGLVASMEEQKQSGVDIPDKAFTSIKTGLMGPIAGVGDTLWQGVAIPLLLSVFVGMAKDGNVAASILYVVIMYAAYYLFGYWLLRLSYRKGSEAVLNLMEGGVINRVIEGAGILGCAVMGGLVNNYVNLTCKIEIPIAADSVFSLQESLFDAIMPGLLPLLLTLLCYKLIKKGWATYWVLLLLVVIGVVGGLIGIF